MEVVEDLARKYSARPELITVSWKQRTASVLRLAEPLDERGNVSSASNAARELRQQLELLNPGPTG